MHFTVNLSPVRLYILSVLGLWLMLGCDDASVLEMSTLQTDVGESDLDLADEDLGLSMDVQQWTDATTPSVPVCTPTLSFDATHLTVVCEENRLQFSPEVHVDGQWRIARECQAVTDAELECDVSNGTLTLTVTEQTLKPIFQAKRPVIFDGFRFRGSGQITGAKGWLSNGFQSSSQSGMLALGPLPNAVETQTALSLQGDLEIARTGRELSWWFSYLSAPIPFIVGATTANQFKTWIQMGADEERIHCTVTNGYTQDNMSLMSGQTIEGDTIYLAFNSVLNDGLDSYARHLPKHVDGSARPELGWNSWYELWDDISPSDIMENARLLAQLLDPITIESQRPYRIIIEDGWQQSWGQWRANARFPNGISDIASQLQSEGFVPGIWLAPFLVAASDPLVVEHPEYFLPEASFVHLGRGEMKILDVTHPQAAEIFKASIQHVVNAGFTLIRLDFLFAGTYGSRRFTSMTAMQAYRLALSMIRDVAGDEVTLVAVGAPPIAGFDIVDSWRLGPDIAVELFEASWFFIPGVARALAARWALCAYILCDTDASLLRQLSQNEATTGLWTSALGGGGLFLSDDLRQLDNTRQTWVTTDIITLATSGQPSLPSSLGASKLPEQLTSQILDQTNQRSDHRVPVEWQTRDNEALLINLTDEPLSHPLGTIPPRTVIRPEQSQID
ncbi:MAG: alpha-galactosidase [Bradymonadia bacterium]